MTTPDHPSSRIPGRIPGRIFGLCAWLILVLLALAVATVFVPQAAAQQQPPSCGSDEHKALDFWVGDWDVSWGEGYPSTGGKAGAARNTITKSDTYKGCVIEENFQGGPLNFNGISLSAYRPNEGLWRQLWMDSSNGYLPFQGGPQEDGSFVFEMLRFSEKSRYMRMVFKNIEADSLTWHWQKSDDKGETWTDQWVIEYQRRT